MYASKSIRVATRAVVLGTAVPPAIGKLKTPELAEAKQGSRLPGAGSPAAMILLVAIAFTLSAVVYSEDADAANYSISAVMTANQIEIASSSGLGFHAAELIMQSDGNLVLYKTTYTPAGASRTAVWSTLTHGNPGARAQFQSDGNLVVYGPQPGNTVRSEERRVG